MKLILILMGCYLHLIQIIDSKKCRIQPDDEVYPYLIDKSVSPYLEYVTIDNLKFEQIDDDIVKVGGYLMYIKSMDPNLPMQMFLRTQYLEKSIWKEGAIQLILPDICSEFLNPSRFWYNISKLWTNCPAKLGDKWEIESQTVNVQIDLPPSIPIVPWRGHILFTQGLLKIATKVGFMLQVELIEI